MPIPLIPVIIAGAVVISGSVTYYFYWKKLKLFFKGKNLIILGSIETGKTTMHNFLRNGEITQEQVNTRRKQKVRKNTFKLEELKLKLSKGVDISGQKDFEKDWKEMFTEANICFYLFNSSEVYADNKEVIEKINNHLKHIGNWKTECKIGPRTIVIGTFADKIPIYSVLDDTNIQKLDEILRSKIRLSYGKISPSEFFIGDLSSEKDIKKMVREILRYLNEH